jgi:MoaA/NifB/PqqE/SkfB family radical SAM enzyme
VLDQIYLDQFKEWFPEKILSKINLWTFCGVHGDPGMARDFYEICEYIIKNSKASITVNTNGGMRNSEWWAKLGKIFSLRSNPNRQPIYRITFSIDGLEDTNHIYRRNVSWNKVMANTSAYINAGGLAVWDYLIFLHNEHQLEEAEKLAYKMKFFQFVPKKALGVDNGKELVSMVALDKEGQFAYAIEAPANPKNRNLENPQGHQPLKFYPFTKDEYNLKKSDLNFKNDYYRRTEGVDSLIENTDFSNLDSCSIKCKSKITGSNSGVEIFIDSHGNVMPCCYIGTHLQGIYSDIPSMQLVKSLNAYGPDLFSLKKHSLEDILNNNHLNKLYAESWNKKSVKEGRMAYCAQTCGVESSIDKIFTHEKVLNIHKEKKVNWYNKNEG